MLNKSNLNSVMTFQQIKVEIELIRKALENFDVEAIDIILMDEKEVTNLFKISRSTLYNYREKYNFKTYSFLGRKYYLKHEIYEELINQLLK